MAVQMELSFLANSHFSALDQAIIKRALDLAKKAHDGQKRLSGEPFITHPVRIAEHLARLGMDIPTLAAALLHDVLEDTDITQKELIARFGEEIAFLVEGVTKFKSILYKSGNEVRTGSDSYVASLKKMFFAMAKDIRVIIIKLADRYHNVETLQYLTPDDQRRVALETLEIYAPIADRLGMGSIKGQLEDMCFPYVYPQEYRELVSSTQARYEDRLKYIEHIKPIVTRYLKDANIRIIDIHSRAKRAYSLFQKLRKYDMDMERVFDLVALRIIVPDVKSCYETLGAIHSHYKPLPGRIKDFIAIPKPNGYQSLHTTVFCEKGKIVEIQIRTPDMHLHAENGIAAHWTYSESGKPRSSIAKAHEVEWVSHLKDTLKSIQTRKGLHDVAIDFFKNRIFVFTPHGDIKDLPDSATPIDFAYAVHTNLGNMTSGAHVNDHIVPLTYELQNGDVVEIIKSKSARPSRDWLATVKTSQARQKIRAWLNRHLNNIAEKPKSSTITHHKTRTRQHAQREVKLTSTMIRDVSINGQHGLMHRFGKCCNPEHGQDIRGYVTLNRGVTVHLASCQNLKKAPLARILDVKWM